jgi:hypothetical protein
MQLTFASLMARAADEPDALYCLAARAVRISTDGLSYRFLMRSGTKFHDGSPLTAHDVAFSLKTLKEKGHPIAQQLLRDFVGAEAPDETTVVVRFEAHRARDVPLFVAALPIFSRSYYSKRPFEETTLEVPLGSGPHTGTRPRTGWPIGMCSAAPRPNRATRAAFPRPGGTIARSQQRSIAKPAVGTLLRNLRKAAEKSFCFCASVTRLTQHYHFLP